MHKVKNKIFSTKLGSLTFALLLVFAGQSYAQTIMKSYSEVSHEVKMTKEDYLKASDPYEFDIPGHQILKYTYRLPQNWERLSKIEEPEEFSKKVETPIVRYVGLPNMLARNSFEVNVIELAREIDLSHWYSRHLTQKGYALAQLSYFPERKRVEAMSVRTELGVAYVVRSVALINGDKVIMAEYHVPDPFWNDNKDEAIWTISHFNLVYKDDRTIEPRKEMAILDIVQFVYPASWQAKMEKITVVDELNTILSSYDGRGVLDGRIDTYFLASHVGGTREQNLETYKNRYTEDVKFSIGDHIESIDINGFHSSINAGRVDVYKGMTADGRSETGHEIWFAILETDTYDGYVFMNTIDREYDFLTWSKNQMSFKIIVESLSLQGELR